MKKYVLKYGFIAGGMMSAFMLMTVPFMSQIGFDYGAIIGYSGMIVAFLMVYFGVRAYRDNVLNGSIRFWQAFKTGLLITAISSACYVATWQVVYFGGLAPNFMRDYTAHTLEKAKAAGTPQAEIDKQVQEMEEFQAMYQNPLVNAAITFIEPLPVGLLFTLLTAGLLSRKRRTAGAAGGLASQT